MTLIIVKRRASNNDFFGSRSAVWWGVIVKFYSNHVRYPDENYRNN